MRPSDSTTEPPSETRAAAPGRLERWLVNRDFARLWYGQTLSSVGDFVFDTTLTIWVASGLLAGSSWAPAAVSGLMLSALIATICVGPIAGVFVDRWNRRRTMLGSEVLRGVLVAVLTLVTLLPRTALPTGVWLAVLYVVVFVVNAAGQFFNPARFATIRDIVDDEADRAKAAGLGQATSAAAGIIGPPLAAPLLFSVGIQWALAVNALSYAVSFFAVRSVRFPRNDEASAAPGTIGARTTWRAEFTAGVRLFLGNRFLVALVTVAVISALGTGAVTPLLIFFLRDNLHTSTHLLGLVDTAYGAGVIAGALLAGRLARLVGARNLTWAGLLAAGGLLVLFARQTDFRVALVLMFLTAIPVAALNAGISPLLMAAAPKAFLGRVLAVMNPLSTGAAVLGIVVAGWLASTAMVGFHTTVLGLHVGRIDTIFTVSAVLIIVAGIYGAFALPSVSGRPGDTQETSQPALDLAQSVENA